MTDHGHDGLLLALAVACRLVDGCAVCGADGFIGFDHRGDLLAELIHSDACPYWLAILDQVHAAGRDANRTRGEGSR